MSMKVIEFDLGDFIVYKYEAAYGNIGCTTVKASGIDELDYLIYCLQTTRREILSSRDQEMDQLCLDLKNSD